MRREGPISVPAEQREGPADHHIGQRIAGPREPQDLFRTLRTSRIRDTSCGHITYAYSGMLRGYRRIAGSMEGRERRQSAGKVKMSLRFEEFLDRSRIRRSTVHSNSIRDHIEDNLKTRNLLKFSDYAGCGVKADLHGQRSTRRGTVL
jgi:hypothetical protein